MTDASVAGPKAPLGVGEIISNGFSILMANFGKVFLLGFLGAFGGIVVNGLLLGFGAATGTADLNTIDPAGLVFGTVMSVVINLVTYAFITALLIQLAYDAKLGRNNSFGSYLSSAIPALLPIIVLSIVVGLLSIVGALALGIGAFWVYGVFYVLVPVAVIEKGGFGSMGRSARLTKEYRWPIVGLFIVVALISALLQYIAGFVVGFLASIAAGFVGQFIGGIGMAMIMGLGYGLGGIVVALTYARLREIKEGVDVDQIAAVFD